MDARDRISAVSLGQLQRNDDDVSDGAGLIIPSAAAPKPGMPGSERSLNTTTSATSVRLRRLFIHQYSQAWFDFRDKRDHYADYFQNSIIATDVHRRFCLDLAEQFPDYSDDLWGITASDSVRGYVVWGGPPIPVRSTAPWCPPRREVRCRFCRRRRCAFCER